MMAAASAHIARDVTAGAKHTPGPWQVEGVRHTGDLKIGSDARLHMVGPDGDAVCAVFYDMKTGRGLRDARLIAAAPELLEALETIRNCWAGHSEECAFAKNYHDKCDCDWPEIAAKCDAAIAKARGQ